MAEEGPTDVVDAKKDVCCLPNCSQPKVPVRREPVHVEAEDGGLQVEEVETEALLHAPQLEREPVRRVLDGVHLHEFGHQVCNDK